MKMIGGGESIKSACRKPDIMADAAYCILTKDSRKLPSVYFVNNCVADYVREWLVV